MTREEAIERLEFLKGVYSVDTETALDMAIEALLAEQNCKDCKKRNNTTFFMDDEEIIDMAIEALQADAVQGEDNEIIKAIHTINNFLDTQGVFLATSMWRAKDGTILKCDWGYFDDGMRAIEKYLKGGAE